MKIKTLLSATALACAGTLSASNAYAEDLTLCWAAWDPANALVELSKDFESKSGHKMLWLHLAQNRSTKGTNLAPHPVLTAQVMSSDGGIII